MKRALLVHGTWILVAGAAFGIGRFLIPTASEPTASQTTASAKPKALGSILDLGQAGEQSAGTSGGESVAVAVSTGSARSMKEKIAAFLGEKDPVKANLAFAQLLLDLTPENAQEVFETLRAGGNGQDLGRQMDLFFQAWGALDGANAIEAAREVAQEDRGRGFRGGPGGFGGGSAVMSVLSSWAGADPEAAKAWVAAVEDPREKGFYNFGLINGMAKSDPDGATAYVLALQAEQAANDTGDQEGPGRGRGQFGDVTSRYMETIANEQISRGLSSATKWAEGLPDGDLKAAALDRIADAYVREDPQKAAAWVSEHASDPSAERAVREVAEGLAASDPKSAIQWAASLPEEAQAQALARTLDQWTRNDPTAASEYLASMPQSTARDAAVSSFARSLDREDPSSAAVWASTIANEEVRQETLSSVARSWMRTDPEAAQQWLPTSGLSAEAQQAVVQDPRQGGPDGFRGGFDGGGFRGRDGR